MTLRLVEVGAVLLLTACAAGQRAPTAPSAPPRPSEGLSTRVGEYQESGRVFIVGEYDGRLLRFSSWYLPHPQPASGFDGRGNLLVDGAAMSRRSIGPEDGGQLKITPVRPVPELIQEALRATPPQPGGLRTPELVELAPLDSTIHLDIRYATTNNFAGTVFYSQARAFLQRPAALALLRAHRSLREYGFGLLIHDGYRPWYVTKTFWDAVPDSVRWLVANPAQGSRHNRGSAVDLTLYDLRTGLAVDMPGTYDEATRRSYPNYPGGTTRQRWHRELLRSVMEAQGYIRNPEEWWHFDYRDWRQYPVLNLRFEELGQAGP